MTSAGKGDLENSNPSAVSCFFFCLQLLHANPLKFTARGLCELLMHVVAKNKSEDWGSSAVHFTNVCYFIYALNTSALALIKILFLPKISLQNQSCKWWEWHKWSLNQILSTTTNLTGQFLFWSPSRQKMISLNKEKPKEITKSREIVLKIAGS